MARFRLVAIDLDGTLLDPDERISARNRQAIARVRGTGAEVVLVTARGFHRARPFAKELGLSLPILCCGGAVIADSATGHILMHRPLPAADALPILEFALTHSLLILVHADGHYFAHPATIAAYPSEAGLVQPPWTASTQLEELVHLGSTFLRALGTESVRALRSVFEPQTASRLRFIELIWRGLPDLGIYDRWVSKGYALQSFCRERNIRREGVLAIGDHASDLSMFEAAGCKIAMANADAELQMAADYVTLSNAEDGVAAALERFIPASSAMPLHPIT